MQRSVRYVLSAVVVSLMFMTIASQSFGQSETTVKGNLAGIVSDSSGAVIPDAAVTATGPTGKKTVQTDAEGKFLLPLLIPGRYSIRVEKSGFTPQDINGIEVFTGRTSNVTVGLKLGTDTQVVEVNAEAATVDVTSTAVGANLSDQFYKSVPVARNVSNLFYTAPGVTNGMGTGAANPSISGGSGLENLYVADGVNITDSAFGGLGTFTRAQGSIGTGINLSFIKEVDVKTGGFEPQYGQATGGVVQIVTKSGSDAYHGALALYGAPEFFRAVPLFRDDFRVVPVGKLVGVSTYEASAELGGYVPHFKDHLFFFGSFDPNWTHNFLDPPPAAGIASLGTQTQRFNTYSWAGKLTYRISDRHAIEFSGFGDPSHTNTDQLNGTLLRVNTTGYSRWEYGTKNAVARYNGTLTNTWLLDGAFRYNNNVFTEFPAADVYQVTDRVNPTTPVLQGFGFRENHNANTFSYNMDTSKVAHFWGDHTFSIGFNHEDPNYDNVKARSGGRYLVPATNAAGGSYLPTATSGVSPVGRMADAQLSLRKAPASCTICPLYSYPGAPAPVPVYLQVDRGEYGGGTTPTEGKYEDAYINDVWTINNHLSFSAGLRWEQQRFTGTNVNYVFNDNWSPRLGVTIDPFGTRLTKLYANYGRYSYPLPLDAAIRSLSTELDLTNVRFLPTIVGGNTVANPILDQAHIINNVPGGIVGNAGVATAGFDPTSTAPYFVVPGTKMDYEDEFVIGAERQYKGIIFTARYLDRRLRRIVEDMGGVSPEASFALTQTSVLGNPSPSLDTFVNEIQKVIPHTGNPTSAECPSGNFVPGPATDANGNVFSPNGICFLSPGPGLTGGEVGPDGKPDGFAKPIRHYSAWEFEANKGFSNNFLMRVNYRYGQLFGNYEGTFRNDNGQTDPGISSLFDFTTGQYNLLGDQFRPGFLPTDRRHIFNTFFSYTVPRWHAKGLVLGTSLRAQSGTPLSVFGDHPAYGNAGEVPLGGRGALGRTDSYANVDVKLEMPWKLSERWTLRTGADLFNIFDTRTVITVDQNRDLSFKAANSNQDFTKPLSFNNPFYARFSVKMEF